MPRENDRNRLTGIFLRLRPFLRVLRRFRGSPDAIAGGFSLGLWLALTPTIGIQIVIAVFLATLFKLSRPAALLSVLVTNPVTVPPLFTFNYWVGKFFFDGPSVREVYGHLIGIAAEMAKVNVWEVGAQIKAFAEIGQDMLLPLFFGSFLVATVSAFFSYILLVKLLRFLQLRRERKKLFKEKQEAARRDASHN